MFFFPGAGGGNDIQWCFSQVKGAVDDDVAEGKKAFTNANFEYRIFKILITEGFLCRWVCYIGTFCVVQAMEEHFPENSLKSFIL